MDHLVKVSIPSHACGRWRTACTYSLFLIIGLIILMFSYERASDIVYYTKKTKLDYTNNAFKNVEENHLPKQQLLIYSYVNLKLAREQGKLAGPHSFEGFCKSMFVNLYEPLKINITYLGWNSVKSTSTVFFTSLLAKIDYTMNEMDLLSHIYSESQLNETIILFVDALDVAIQFSKSQIIDIFNSFPKDVIDTKVIYMAEKQCMNGFAICDGSEFKTFQLPNDTFGTLYLNSGVFIGKYHNVFYLMKVLHNEILSMQGKQSKIHNDQGLMVKLWNDIDSILHKPLELIWIDYYSHISASMLIRNENNRWATNPKIYLKTYDENTNENDGFKYRYFNSEIGNFPAMVHFNGVRDPWSWDHFPEFKKKNKMQPISGNLHIPITSDGKFDLYKDMCSDYTDLYF